MEGLLGVCLLGSGVLWVGRLVHRGTWLPIRAHVDGLLLAVMLLTAVTLYLQTRARLRGIAAFVGPLVAVMLGWAVCASAWTYHPFRLTDLSSFWRVFHLSAVYAGTAAALVAAGAGAGYLWAEARLKRGELSSGDAAGAGGARGGVNLESLEGLMVRSAGAGFACIGAGLISGAVVLSGPTHTAGGTFGADAGGGWVSPKVVLAVAAWGVYGVLLNVRWAWAFRGRRAAWMSIGGVVLLLVVYGLVSSTSGDVDELEDVQGLGVEAVQVGGVECG